MFWNSTSRWIKLKLREERNKMDDILYIAITIGFFVLTLGLMKLCEVLGESKKGERS